MTVVDSSVIVDLLIERLEVEALGTDALAAPHLIDSEVLNSLRGLWLAGHVADTDASRLIQAFTELGIERYPAAPLSTRVWELRHNLSAYDATYVALAEALDTVLLTTDARIARAPGIRCAVEVC